MCSIMQAHPSYCVGAIAATNATNLVLLKTAYTTGSKTLAPKRTFHDWIEEWEEDLLKKNHVSVEVRLLEITILLYFMTQTTSAPTQFDTRILN
mmetsp:Transcript_34935/g.64673  ORF Transcript_34935/g.64673 Transcript_34935/m.64673 type:complete len:94 (+) Transcript_34935:2132-2413(+)